MDLAEAAYSNNLTVARKLIEQGADVNQQNKVNHYTGSLIVTQLQDWNAHVYTVH